MSFQQLWSLIISKGEALHPHLVCPPYPKGSKCSFKFQLSFLICVTQECIHFSKQDTPGFWESVGMCLDIVHQDFSMWSPLMYFSHLCTIPLSSCSETLFFCFLTVLTDKNLPLSELLNPSTTSSLLKPSLLISLTPATKIFHQYSAYKHPDSSLTAFQTLWYRGLLCHGTQVSSKL